MSILRLVAIAGVAAVCLTCILAGPAAAQPDSAAWIGTSPIDPTDYGLPGNWIDLATGGIPPLPPDATSAVFFDSQAGQAPRDGEGNVVVALNRGDLGAESASVQSLPFRFTGGGTLTIGQLAGPDLGTLSVQEMGMLTLDQATLNVRDSVLVGGGPPGPTGLPSGINVLPEGSLVVNETIQLSQTSDSLFQLLGGTVRAATVDTGIDPGQFRWNGGQLSVDTFLGDLDNPSGALNPGVGPVLATIDGSYSQDSNARLNLQIGGTTLGQTYDHLDVNGTLNAGGTLAVSLLADFTPSAGDEFDLLNFASLSGVFENVILPGLPAELEWNLDDLHSQGILRVVQPGLPVTRIAWSGAADNDYFNPANWANGIVPVNTENASFGVSIPGGATVSIGGAGAVAVTEFMLARGGIFDVSGGVNFEVVQNASISGRLNVSGPASTFVTGNAPVDLVGAPQLVVTSGGLLQAAANRYGVTVDPGLPSVLLLSSGVDSLLDLSSMEEFAVDTDTNSSFFVSAAEGDIDLSGLNSIAGVPGGLGRLVLRASSGGGLHFGNLSVSNRANVEAAGAGSTIDVADSLQLGASTRLSLTGGAEMRVGGDLLYDIVAANDFNASGGVVQFVGSGVQMLEVGGQDLGAISQGGPTTGNFGLGKLVVGQPGMPTTLMLTDGTNNGGGNEAEALYIYGVGPGISLEIMEGSMLMMNGRNVYTRGLTSSGRLVLDGVLAATNIFENKGVLSGTGSIAGELVVNNGILSPGSSAGEIEIDGDVEAGGDSVMQIEIGGPVPAMQHDKVTITKTMMLDGALEVTLIDGGMGAFEPIKGDRFEILSANGGIQGTFTDVSLPPLPSALGWQLQYAPTVVSLEVLPRLGGDFDADGDVDRDDLTIWRSGVGLLTGASQTDGDDDGDGDVDGDDLLGMLLNFGVTPSAALTPNSGAVPEPGGLVLAGVLLLLAASRACFQPLGTGRWGTGRKESQAVPRRAAAGVTGTELAPRRMARRWRII